MLGAAATGAYPAPPPRNQLNSFAGLWHASGDTLPPDEPGPFNESFVLYQVRKRISFAMPFYTQNDHHFTKTGSGQTQGKHSKTDRACASTRILTTVQSRGSIIAASCASSLVISRPRYRSCSKWKARRSPRSSTVRSLAPGRLS